MGSRMGKRYEEPKLNIKKVFAVIIAIIVIVMSILMIKNILKTDKKEEKITSKDYFVVYKDNKYGVIDEKGNYIIDPSYAEMIVIPNSKKDIFLVTYDVNYDTGDYKTKVLNSNNQEIFTEYSQVEAIQNKDESNNVWYEENVLRVKKDGKYGLISFDGKQLTSYDYDSISAIQSIKNAYRVLKNGRYGVIDNTGKELVKAEYLDVTNLGKDNKEGFIVKNAEGKSGIVDYSGQVVIETKYDEVKKVYGNQMYVVKQEGKEVIAKKDGTVIELAGYDEIKEILKSEDNGFIYTKNGKYGIMKLTGEAIIDAEYDDLKESKTGIYIAKKDSKYGIIDINKEIKVQFIYTNITYNEKADLYVADKEDFTNDIIGNDFLVKLLGILIELNDEKGYIELRQENEYKYYNFKFEEKAIADINQEITLFVSKKDGKYGFTDKSGKVIVDYIYDDATEQNIYGFAAIKKDGKWGSIDSKGNVVQEPIYNLDNYLKIDFIGRWHYGMDLNMNYYNQL